VMLRRAPQPQGRRTWRGATLLRGAAVAALLASAGCQGGDEDALSVVIALPDQQLPPSTKATLVVDYSGTGARLLSEAGGPACAFILPGVDGDFSDDRQGTLTIQASGPRATRGPADLAACRMKSSDEGATAADLAAKLTVRVQAAEDAAGKPVDVSAAQVRQGGGAGGGAPVKMTDSDIEEAQAKAVKTAASIKKAPTEDPATTETPVVSGPSGFMGGAGANPPSGQPASAARPAAPGNVPRPSGAAVPAPAPPKVVDNSAMPVGQDRDPSYDDSPAEDESVPAYSLDFAVQEPGVFGALQLDINHLGNSGGFIGREDKVDCVPLVEAIVASNYLGERLTKIGLISLQGIRTPAAIMRCGFRTRENLSAGSFLIEVTDASDTKSDQIDPPPTVYIKTITPRR
jgi:hypothetical protein